MKRGIGYLESIWILTLFLIINAGISFFLQYFFMNQFLSKRAFLILLILTFIIPLTIIYFIYKKRIKISYYIKIKLYNYPLLLILSFFLQILGVYIESFSALFIPNKYYEEYNRMKDFLMPSNNEELILSFLSIGLVAPFCEEFLFRGILLKGLLLRTNHFWISNFFQSFLFGLAHLNTFQFLYAVPIGFLIGYIFIKTKNLYFPILIHIFTNSMALFIPFLDFDFPLWNDLIKLLSENKNFYSLPLSYFFLSVFIILFISFFINKFNKKIYN